MRSTNESSSSSSWRAWTRTRSASASASSMTGAHMSVLPLTPFRINAWRANAGRYWEEILAAFPHGSCGERDPVDCFAAERFKTEHRSANGPDPQMSVRGAIDRSS